LSGLGDDASVVCAGATPERWLDVLARGGFDNVVFLDAVRTQAPAGSVVMLDAAGIEAAYPQISTHKIALATLARFIAGESRAAVWVLGIVPGSLRAGEGLSETVQASSAALRVVIRDLLRGRRAETAGSVPS
jgi:hydrogenase maturation protease